jgi:hypothetical protein
MRLFSPFVLSLSKDERISSAFLHTLFSPASAGLRHILTEEER